MFQVAENIFFLEPDHSSHIFCCILDSSAAKKKMLKVENPSAGVFRVPVFWGALNRFIFWGWGRY
jgi:hypothetical protein